MIKIEFLDMKLTTFICFLILSKVTSFGQTMFFDDLNSAIWISSGDVTESTLRSDKSIPLSKLVYSKDSIDQDVTIWTFRDSQLTIVQYSFEQKSERVVATYHYTAHDNSLLQITLPDGSTVAFTVGIVSTGNYAILYRKKEKKR
jgi:hypothetical protein